MKIMKIVPALAVVAAMAMPTGVFANTDIKNKYLVDADVKAQGTTIEVNASLKGGSLVDSTLLNGGEWQIVDQDGKTLFVKKTTKAKVHAKIENLKPEVEYCLDVRVKGKVLNETVQTKLNVDADQKIALTKKGLKIKDGMLCVTTGKPDPKDPVNPKVPNEPVDPKNPENPKNPKDPVDPKNPENPKNPKEPVETKNPENPKEPVKEDTNPKTEPKEEPKQSWLDWLLGLF